jgi:hypothetical protein
VLRPIRPLVPPAVGLLAAGLLASLPGCDALSRPEAHAAPSAERIRALFEYEGELAVEMSGNVAQVTVVVDPVTYARGGHLWARAVPFLFLFSPAAREAFEENPGLGGLRVITRHPNGDWMARAMVSREVLSSRDWDLAVSLAGRARRDATERPGRMLELVRWGEDRADFEYNPDYIDPR